MDESVGFPKIEVIRKTGNEEFRYNGWATGATLIDFWRWSASNLMSNATRGVLSEYLVACALDIADGVRVEWDAYDLLIPKSAEFSKEIRIEVKSSAYLQSWEHKKLSKIIFSIRPTYNLAEATNDSSNDLKRQADIYVFCVLKHEDKPTVDPLDTEQWDFYILPASTLNEKFPTQKSISLSSLKKLHPCKAKFDEIKGCVRKLSS